MTRHQRQHYRFDQPVWDWVIALAFVILFAIGQMMDKTDAAADLQATADAKTEAVQSAKQHALDEQLAHDMRLAAIEYARDEQRKERGNDN
ncbi:MAG: hypothetical protein LWW74_06865 [Burkholderiales bacterium]|nr:hypothetical protein [Burkholderiales bacterium]